MTAVNTRRKIRKTAPVDVLNRSCKPAFAVLPPDPPDFLLTRVSPLATQDDSTTPGYPRIGSVPWFQISHIVTSAKLVDQKGDLI